MGLSDRRPSEPPPPARDVDDQVHDEHDRRGQVPPVEWLWEGEEQRSPRPQSRIPETTTLIVTKVRIASEARRRRLALDPWAQAHELCEHPSNPVATLCQVDNDQAGEGQPHVRMDGVPDVEELQGPQSRREEGQEAKVHEPARPGTPRGPRSGRSFGRGADGPPLRSSWVLGIHGRHLSIWAVTSPTARRSPTHPGGRHRCLEARATAGSRSRPRRSRRYRRRPSPGRSRSRRRRTRSGRRPRSPRPGPAGRARRR